VLAELACYEAKLQTFGVAIMLAKLALQSSLVAGEASLLQG